MEALLVTLAIAGLLALLPLVSLNGSAGGEGPFGSSEGGCGDGD